MPRAKTLAFCETQPGIGTDKQKTRRLPKVPHWIPSFKSVKVGFLWGIVDYSLLDIGRYRLLSGNEISLCGNIRLCYNPIRVDRELKPEMSASGYTVGNPLERDQHIVYRSKG